MKVTNVKVATVSVIIPALNAGKVIEKCLKSIASQDYKNIEVIVIDDFSSDQTSTLVKNLARKFNLTLKIMRNKRRLERSASRNLGAKVSKGDFLLFIDSDMYLSKTVISDCIKVLNVNLLLTAIIIPEKSVGEGFWAKCRGLEKQCYIGDNRLEAARFFKKVEFWKVGGWDEKMISGEDWDITKRVREKYGIGRVKSFIYHHEYRLTLWRAMKKKFYYASVSGIYLEKNPLSLLSVIFFIFRPSFIRNWKLILSRPIYGLGLFYLKFMELSAGVAGFLFARLINRF